MTDPQVLIVGAGPVGLYTALLLTRQGVPVDIVDTGVWACQHSYALALHPQSVELFQEIGLQDKIATGAYPVRTLVLYDESARKAEVRVAEPPGGMLVLRQDHLESLLEAALNERGVKVRWRHEVSDLVEEPGHVAATIGKLEKESRGYIVAHTEWVVGKKTRLGVPYVVGADGYSSRVRRALNADYPEVGPAQYFAVFEFRTNADLHNEMSVVLSDSGAAVLWPLPGGLCRWSFQLPGYSDKEAEALKDRLLQTGFGYFPTDRPKDREVLGEAPLEAANAARDLKAFIAERAPWFKGSVDEVVWHTLVRFERRLASRFGNSRLWLAGDSAHLTGPVAIQSMNLGLLEAKDLAETLGRVIRLGASPRELEVYAARWSSAWKQMHGLDGGLRPTQQTDPWIAARTKELLACLPASGARLAALAAQLRLEA